VIGTPIAAPSRLQTVSKAEAHHRQTGGSKLLSAIALMNGAKAVADTQPKEDSSSARFRMAEADKRDANLLPSNAADSPLLRTPVGARHGRPLSA